MPQDHQGSKVLWFFLSRKNIFFSLRGRLVLSTFAVCFVAVLVTDWIDSAHWWPPEAEPYQDAIVLGAFTVVLLALLWVVSGWTLRPVMRASAEARAVGPGSAVARISEAALPAELRPLAGAVNGALARLSAALLSEQRFIANAAHELRTPLAVLDLRLRRARETGQTDWAAVEADLAALTRRVSQILNLARLEGGAEAAERVNLARVAREAAALVLPLAEAEGRALAVDVPPAMPVVGRAGDLRDLLRNLLENALRHGRGAVRVQGRCQGGEMIVAVSDEGAGVPAAEREAVFQRFRGGDGGGAGLGLAIVREVARAHGGWVGFVEGAGCTIELRLAAA